MAITVIDNFDSYSDGDLNGQGGWSGDTTFDVQGTTTQQGAKAIKCAAGYGSDQFISKSVTAKTSGIYGIYGRFSATGLYNLSFTLFDSSTPKFNIYLRNDACGCADGSGAQNKILGSSQSTNTWYLLELEIDQANNRGRGRLNGGTWSDWISYTFSHIDKIRIGAAFFSGQDAYYDYITFDDLVTFNPSPMMHHLNIIGGMM